ncbi:MAG TPA: di-heme-cytochrome C peroxidase [Vicinamibacterales bacterium]|nr:di-heme-cytochrome C peroxidase [Vicinamibacterales bacterium]
MRTRTIVRGTAIFLAGIAVAWLAQWMGAGQPAPVAAPALPAPPVAEGTNGLTVGDREAFYHLSEGGELYPVDWLLALEVESTAPDGTLQVRPFLENVERYGLLSDAKSAGNPDGLPVGVSLGKSKASGIDMIGLNCAACHVGQVQYQGHAVRIDGLGNMALINAFLADLASETQKTLTSPRRLVRFWQRVHQVRAERRRRGREAGIVADDESKLRRVVALLTSNRDMLQARLRALKGVASLQHWLEVGTKEGYGRLDAFGIGRDELFGATLGNSAAPNAPVSFPHIWGMEYTGWLQWGANTDSVMERNIGQALGVGALFDPRTFRSTVNIPNLHRLEQYGYRLTPPQWPVSFPAIDQARADRGKALFVQYCARCHETYKTDGLIRTYQLFSFTETGTDPLAAINFEMPVAQADGTVRAFPYAASDLIKKIKQRAYRDANYDAATIESLENRAVRTGAQWEPMFRAPMLDSANFADTAGRKVYRSKTLVGIWATGPFLHNGSVPTIYDLLLPAAKRPATFTLGTREYDPVKLGIQLDPSKYTLAPEQSTFTFDTRLPGNWNTGHEWSFYPDLDDAKRYDIIEFLKTFTSESAIGMAPEPGYRAAAITSLPDSGGPAYGAPPPLLQSLSWRVRLVLLFLLAIAGWLAYFVVNGVLPHGEAARATEAEDTATLTRGILTIQQRFAAEQHRSLARGTHAKGICVRGQFEVFDLFDAIPDRALASRLAHGIFARPGIYPAVIRFANGNSQIRPDAKKDVRACSFSIDVPPGVSGALATRHDFSMNNARTFPINDVHAFAVATTVAAAPSPARGFRSLRMRDKLCLLRILGLAAFQERPAGVAYQQDSYWSTVPFHHGPADVVKYGAFPCAGNAAMPLDDGPNCLQDELARHVMHDAQMSCFDVGLQLLEADRMTYWGRRRPPTFWIENASVRWKESQAPFHMVARLTLVANSVLPPDAAAAMWIDVNANSAADSKPIGGINRARSVAEGASRDARLGAASGAAVV